MATTLTLDKIQMLISGTYKNALDLETATSQINIKFEDDLGDGTAVDTADLWWSDQRSVANGTPDDIDVAGGITDVFGNSLTFVKIKGIFIRNTSTTAAEILNVGGDATAALVSWVGDSSDVVNVGPGGFFGIHNPSAAGYTVTASTGDILQIASASGTITYDIVLYGTSA